MDRLSVAAQLPEQVGIPRYTCLPESEQAPVELEPQCELQAVMQVLAGMENAQPLPSSSLCSTCGIGQASIPQ